VDSLWTSLPDEDDLVDDVVDIDTKLFMSKWGLGAFVRFYEKKANHSVRIDTLKDVIELCVGEIKGKSVL